MNIMKTEMKPSWIRRGLAAAIIIVVMLVLVSNIVVLNSADGKIYSIDSKEFSSLGNQGVAIVLGASVSKNQLNKVYELRVGTALELYKQNKVQNILVSGDGNSKYYDEITPAINYLRDRGVPAEYIMGDSLGLDTYDSIQRALEVYGVRKVVIVSQSYHLPRAIFIANSLGVDAIGVSAPDAGQNGRTLGGAREWYARVKAFVEVLVSRLTQ